MLITAKELQQVLHSEIPLTTKMGIRVMECTHQSVVLSAPLSPNINHKCTAFGGSLYSVAVLSGWSLIYTQLKEHQLEGHIVIQHSEVDYKQPVDGEIIATCKIDDINRFEKFFKLYQRKKIARIALSSSITHNETEAVVFNGQYVVHY